MSMLVLDTESFEAEERVIREYLIDMIREYDGQFTRFGQTPHISGGKLSYSPGEISVGEFVEQERDSLEEIEENGIIKDWYIETAPESSTSNEPLFDEEGMRLQSQFMDLSLRFSLALYEEFDEIPAAVDEFPGTENGGPPCGMWMLFHFMSNKAGYSSIEEVDMCVHLLEEALGNVARGWSIEEMEEKTEEIIAEIEEIPSEIKDRHENLAGTQRFTVQLDEQNEYLRDSPE